jgi:hypothetical protein
VPLGQAGCHSLGILKSIAYEVQVATLLTDGGIYFKSNPCYVGRIERKHLQIMYLQLYGRLEGMLTPCKIVKRLERETGLEPVTSSLGSWHSTTELLPQSLENQ